MNQVFHVTLSKNAVLKYRESSLEQPYYDARKSKLKWGLIHSTYSALSKKSTLKIRLPNISVILRLYSKGHNMQSQRVTSTKLKQQKNKLKFATYATLICFLRCDITDGFHGSHVPQMPNAIPERLISYACLKQIYTS